MKNSASIEISSQYKYQILKKFGLVFSDIFTKSLTPENLNSLVVSLYIFL